MTVTSSYSILLVEDDANDILLIQRAFRQVNLVHPIRIVQDGAAAIAYLAGEDPYRDRDHYPLPHLILLDLKLPRRSGLEVLAWLKQQPSLKRIPVVILTSSREDIDVDRAYDMGASSYLLKPVTLDSLFQMIEAISTYWLRLNQYPSFHTA